MKSKRKVLPVWAALPLSLAAWGIGIFYTVVISFFSCLFVLPASLLLEREKRSSMHIISRFWARAILAANPFWRFKITGLEHLDPKKHYVIVANHQSLLDILAVLAGLRTHFKFIAKKELFPIPFLGWHMAGAAYIALERESRESGRKAMEKARGWLQKSVSVLFFPEGTRSLDGQIHPFKRGAFKLAAEEKIEILPVVIDGTGDAIPKKSVLFGRHSNFCLSIGKPRRIPDGAGGDPEKTIEAIRGEMIHTLETIRRNRS